MLVTKNKSDKSKYWQEDQGRELERKSEDDLPAAGGSAEGEESQENSQSQSHKVKILVMYVTDSSILCRNLILKLSWLRRNIAMNIQLKMPPWRKSLIEFKIPLETEEAPRCLRC